MTDGNFINFGSYTVTVSDCGSALCSSVDFAPLANNLGFILTKIGGGSLLDTSGSRADLSVTFEVTTTSAILNEVLVQAAGSSTGAGVAKVTENAFDSYFSGTGSGAAYAGGGTTIIPFTNPGDSNLPPYSDIFLTKDISADSSSGGTATITSVTQSFAVPEPGSVGLLGLGFLAMLIPKRRRS